jgi:hypothetical protein
VGVCWMCDDFWITWFRWPVRCSMHLVRAPARCCLFFMNYAEATWLLWLVSVFVMWIHGHVASRAVVWSPALLLKCCSVQLVSIWGRLLIELCRRSGCLVKHLSSLHHFASFCSFFY